ncbi:PhnD/SsuA/transferrin family substrate-binding protein [Haladaptatus cibarius]|uniref:PhnD/SsuA/transferrin family substrate-binding protein n=1 Tax=Haladaptatus cibarius TaxID=453847 RepID=UPI00067964E9|nr:PhnD/SsuA/transferrin family substrate-binding protein [Haladaptatus cibarius]
MVKRRTFIRTASAAGILGLAGCTGDNDDSGNDGDGSTTPGTGTGTSTKSGDGETVNFILTPAEASVNVKQQYKGLFDYIESETGVTVESTKAASYPAVFQALKGGRGDLADASPTLAVVGDEENVTDVVGIRVAYGSAKYFSLISTTPDSGANNLSDLEGESVTFGSKISTSGSLFPLYMLQEAGLDIGNAPEGTPNGFDGQWAGDHDTALNQMMNRPDVMAAGTGAFVAAPHIPKDQFPSRFKEMSSEFDNAGSEDEELKLLKASQPIPRAPILSRSNWDSPKREEVEQALIDATEEDLKGDASGDNELWFTGVQEGDVNDYDPVKNVKNSLGLEFGN